MMKILVLASGSKGNATYLETEQTKIMIDCGISFRQIKNRSLKMGIEIKELDALIITHEHNDHVGGVTSLLGNIETKVHLRCGAYAKMHENVKNGIKVDSINFIEDQFVINDLKITVINVSHDSGDPVGFIFENKGKKVVFITDTGYIHERLLEKIIYADAYFIESNYEPELLLESNRPFYLKQRILSNRGHLSNIQCALILKNILSKKTKIVCFLHISEECNSPSEAEKTHRELINNYNKFKMIYAKQHQPTELIEI